MTSRSTALCNSSKAGLMSHPNRSNEYLASTIMFYFDKLVRQQAVSSDEKTINKMGEPFLFSIC